MTIMEGGRGDNGGGMEISERPLGPPDGARSAPSPSHPRGHVIPAKAGTYWRALPTRKREPTLCPRNSITTVIPA